MWFKLQFDKWLCVQFSAQNAVESTVQLRPTSFPNDEFASRRQKAALSRQNSRQSVKSLIESIENAAGSKPPTKTGKYHLISIFIELNALIERWLNYLSNDARLLESDGK